MMHSNMNVMCTAAYSDWETHESFSPDWLGCSSCKEHWQQLWRL